MENKQRSNSLKEELSVSIMTSKHLLNCPKLRYVNLLI